MTTSAKSNALVDRVSLRNLIDSERRLDELGIARVVASVAEVVHKQQKGGQPLNTLTPDGIVVRADGEIALEPGATAQPAYTAPERLRDEAGDRRSDVFSLGAILWEALTQQQLFAGDIDGEIKAAVLEGEYRSASEANANVPSELDAICKKALSRTPADRYPSCKVLAAELSTVLDDAGYPEDNSRIADHVSTKYVAPKPKLAKVPTSRDTPMPGTPIVTAPVEQPSLLTAPPTQTLQGVAPRKELEAALELTKKKESIGSATLIGAPPVVAPAPAAAPASGLPSWATARSADADKPAPAKVEAKPDATPEPAPESKSARTFSKTAVLGSLSNADLALPPVEESTASPTSTPAVPVGRKTEVHGSASLADRLAAINEGTDSAKPGAVLMLGLPAVPPGADPSSFKTPLPGSITTAETVATPALAGYAQAEAKAAAALEAVKQPIIPAAAPNAPTMIPQAPVLPPSTPSQAVQMPAAGTATAVDSGTVTAPSTTSESGGTPHPASVVALPRPRSQSEGGRAATQGEKRDPLAGWGWGTGPHEAISDHDDDFYEAQQSNKKRLVFAIGGAAAAVLLIVVAAFAFGGSKDEKKPDVAAKKAEPAVDWSQPTDPPPAPAPAQPDPNAGSAVDPNAAGSAVDPNAGSAGSAVAVDPNAAGSAAAVDPNLAANPGSAAAPPTTPPPTTPITETPPTPPPAPPAPVAKTEPPKPEPVKVEPPKPEPPKPVAKVEPKKPEPKKPEPKKIAKAEPKTKKLPPPQPVAKTKSGSWDPLAPKTAKGPAPVDPYAAETPKKVDANAAYKTGIQQFARGDANAALSTFKSSLASNPDFAPTWRGIGMVYEKLGKRSQAKTAFKRYLQLSPGAGDAESIRERMERL